MPRGWRGLPRFLACAMLASACATATERAVDDTRVRVGEAARRLDESDAETERAVELERDAVAANHRSLVARNLPLSHEEGSRFWPLYDRYHAELRALNDRLVKLVESFALEREDPAAERTLAMIEEALAIREGRLALRRRYVEEFEEVLPTPKLLRYFQIESKLDALIDYELARSVPLAP